MKANVPGALKVIKQPAFPSLLGTSDPVLEALYPLVPT